MRAPVSWLRELVAIPADQSGRDIAERLIRAGLEVETVECLGEGVDGALVVGRVVSIEELTEFKKPIRWCQVEADGLTRGIICGARNFREGDHVVVALPGTVLPGGFTIATRETYGHVSDGMLCSERELGLGDGHDGIIVLDGAAQPGSDARELLGIGDEILDIAVTPDRGYALSMRGLARELAISYDVPFADPGTEIFDLPAPAAGHVPLECASDDLDACDLFTLRTIIGFDPQASSPAWMQRRLAACGMRPISLAVDVTNYVMLELGQPLHAFDMGKLRGTVRAARPVQGTQFETLDHVVRTLSSDDLVIADDRGPIGLAGTMGGLESEIDEETTAIALEAAHFSSNAVARMARRHKLSSEASRRFERGVDRDLAPYASARATALLLEFGGGSYAGMTGVEAAHYDRAIDLAADAAARTAGLEIPAATVTSLLERIGCAIEVRSEVLHVTPPSWREDITDPADLVEEVLRLIGYDEIPSRLPIAAVGHGLTASQRMRRRVGAMLAARGMTEVLSYPFVSDGELDALLIPVGDPRRSTVRLANPMSEEQPWLRASLLPGLVAAARRNTGRGAEELALFEVGSVYRGTADAHDLRPSVSERPSSEDWNRLNAALPDQPLHAAMLLSGAAEVANWWGSGRAHDWSDAIGTAVTALDALGLSAQVRAASVAGFHPGRCAELVCGDAVLGVAGELHPRVCEAAGLPARSVAAELDLGAAIAIAPDARRAPVVLTQPVAKEDIALVVDRAVPAESVRRSLEDGAGEILESVRLFDVYEGPQVPAGKRSLAFALRFRAADRTLAAEEIAAAREAALAVAERDHGATLR